jgi:hypothetical protein
MTAKQLLVWWNNSYPYDRLYREKYNIAFNSPQHRALRQIDVRLSFFEDDVFKQAAEKRKIEKEKEKRYSEGVWLERFGLDDPQASEKEDELFDKMQF